MNYIFFGSSPISIVALEALKDAGFLPKVVVTKPDAPQGRGLEVLPSPVKIWAENEGIPVLTPESLKDKSFEESLAKFSAEVGVLVSYGKIIPLSIIELFPKGIVNLHPSLLPLLRGPAPFEYSVLTLDKDQIGVSIMLLDKGMDSGPILAQVKIEMMEWPLPADILYSFLGGVGADLLAETLPRYMEGKITPTPQSENGVTFSKMLTKEDGEISLSDDAFQNYKKYLALARWPGVFFFEERNGKKIRVKIKTAKYESGSFLPLTVIPEGKKEMPYEDFKRGTR